MATQNGPAITVHCDSWAILGCSYWSCILYISYEGIGGGKEGGEFEDAVFFYSFWLRRGLSTSIHSSAARGLKSAY